MQTVETDYLVVGAAAAGMAFTDALLTHSDATITIVDRGPSPGGHWLDAYPFVRLHQPSAFYGVDSVPLGLAGRPRSRSQTQVSSAVIKRFALPAEMSLQKLRGG